MNVQAAAISVAGQHLVIALVRMDLLQTQGEADLAIDSLQNNFGGTPVVLMAQTENGSPQYYGDRDLVELLEEIPVDKMPWKEYAVS